MSDITIRPAQPTDASAILALYVRVADVSGGLARDADEMSAAYVGDFVAKSLSNGVILVAESGGRIVGELHTYGAGLRKFAHVLSGLTVAVHPEAQGRGIGRMLFTALLAEVRDHRPDIVRIELVTQASNIRGQRLYESLGFRRQGEFEQGIRGPDGGLESDIPMAWLRSPTR